MIAVGTYRARQSGAVVLGASAQKGTPFIETHFRVVEGEHNGETARWTSYFTENTNERTIQSLQIAGWVGEDLSEFGDGEPHGLDANEVNIVVEHETYNDKTSGEEKTVAKVAWVNRVGGYLNTAASMTPEAAQSFGERMRGLVLKMRAKTPAPATPPSTDPAAFPFGANTPAGSPPTAPSRKAF